MSRKGFLRGLLVPLTSLGVWYVLVTIWHETSRPFETGHLFARDAALVVALLGAWMAIFPAWRFLLRSRLHRRARPLWWAEVPGLAVLASIAVVIGIAVLRHAGIVMSEQPTAIRWFLSGLGLGLSAVGFLSAVALTIDALRPDRGEGHTDVFR